MILADCHLHSEFSSDSDTPVTTMLECALRDHMKYFYLTDHHDIDFPPESGCNLSYQLDTDSYLARLRELKMQYAGQIEVRFGVELGLMKQITDKLNAYTNKYPFDFIIGSSHLVRGKDPYYPDYYVGRSEIEAYRDYFISIDENVHAFHDYDVYGHLDYVVRYGPTKNKNWKFSDYSDVFESFLKKIIEDGKGIEINTAGLYKGLGYPHPHADILRMYKALGGEIITIGSDAHTPENFAYGFDTVEALLDSCGFRYYTIFKERKPEFIPISV